MKYKIIDDLGQEWITFQAAEMVDLNLYALQQFHPARSFQVVIHEN